MIERYLNLIEGTLRAALENESVLTERSGELSMSCGLVLPAARLGLRQSSFYVSRYGAYRRSDPSWRCVDGAGHSRSMYRGLLLRSLRWAFGTGEGAAELFTDSLASMLRSHQWIHQEDVARGERAAQSLLERRWFLAKDAKAIVGELWSIVGATCPAASRQQGELFVDALCRFVNQQRASGEWFMRSSSDNPEPLWYHEMVALHALSSSAVAYVHRDAINRSARYIAAEVQPDHASSQPWAIHALLGVPDGVYLADMMLHAAGVQQPSTMDAVSLILLADALDCLRGEDQRK